MECNLTDFRGLCTLLCYETSPASSGDPEALPLLWLDLFLGVEESAVEGHFLDCGNIVAVRVVRDPLTGVGRGFGYVLFEVRVVTVL